MQLPIKITPDRIRDSIVQVSFNTNYPFEALIGMLYKPLLDLGFIYTNRVLPKPRGKSGITAVSEQLFEVNVPPQHFFFNDEVKVQLFQNYSFIFNCLGDYIGWDKYISAIKLFIEEARKKIEFSCFNRVGIRFISEFPNIDVFNITNFNLEMQGMSKPLLTGNFKVEWFDNPYNVIVTLASKSSLPAFNRLDSAQINGVSLIDIDIIQKDLDLTTEEGLFRIIEDNHLKQKELFFGLLKDEFLRTLNPEY